jgi:hypothetical protein
MESLMTEAKNVYLVENLLEPVVTGYPKFIEWIREYKRLYKIAHQKGCSNHCNVNFKGMADSF